MANTSAIPRNGNGARRRRRRTCASTFMGAWMRDYRDDNGEQPFGAERPERRRVRRRTSVSTVERDATKDWRVADAYERLRGIDRAGIMWEYLRRDPGYVAWYAEASTATSGRRGAGFRPEQWGLHFR